MITLVLFIWSLPLIFGIKFVFIPYFKDLIEERRWQRMHPGMPSWRRGRT